MANPDFSTMTDEEIRNFDPSTLEDESTEVVDDTPTEEAEPDDDNSLSAADDAVDPPADGENKEEVADATPKDPAEVGDTAKAEGEAVTPEAVIDYKALYEQMTAPFKANGREIQVKTVEDAVALMQMGANYNKKMAGLKPNLKLMKMLESNGLLNEDKLSYLIDLDKKDPEAINRLVKDSGLDPLDLSAEKADSYKPKTYTVDEREMALDEVLGGLQDSPHYTKTLEVVGSTWDGASKSVIADTPAILNIIHDHVANGIYDIIATEVESEKTFGRLKGLSDLDAYKQVGDKIQARGGFAHLGHQKQEPTPSKIVAPALVKTIDSEALRDKKRAASSTKTAVPTSNKMDYNPLTMSDAEFLKMAKPTFT